MKLKFFSLVTVITTESILNPEQQEQFQSLSSDRSNLRETIQQLNVTSPDANCEQYSAGFHTSQHGFPGYFLFLGFTPTI